MIFLKMNMGPLLVSPQRSKPPRLGVADIGPHRQHPEKDAQNVFSLGHPGNRFHMKRMN